jgi:hypothetical protein
MCRTYKDCDRCAELEAENAELKSKLVELGKELERYMLLKARERNGHRGVL